MGHYFNLADSVRLSAQEFVWRDLFVDVLVLPTGQVQVVDEDEVPEALDEGLRSFIESSKHLVLRDHRAIIEEAATRLNGYVCVRPGEDFFNVSPA